MCLDINKNQNSGTLLPSVAIDDITCYKVVRKFVRHTLPKKGIYYTVYQHYPVRVGRVYESKLIVEEYYNTYSVDYGLHSFVNLEDAETVAYDKCAKVIECIIPKGSEYYTGTFLYCGERFKSHASNKIKYVKVVKSKTN